MSSPDFKKLLCLLLKKRGKAIFVTGTDTGVGKTWIVCKLIESLNRQGYFAVGFKPICCGDRDDVRKIRRVSGKQLSEDLINPIYLSKPLAPIAQKAIPQEFLIQRIQTAFFYLTQMNPDFIFVEGAGGFFCPISKKLTFADLARKMNFEVLVVAPNRLGVLNHTLLTVRAIQSYRLKCIGVLLNHLNRGVKKDLSQKTNLVMLKKLLRHPVYSISEP